MRILILIVIGLTLIGCETTSPTVKYNQNTYSNDGNNFTGRNGDILRKGMSKIEFCQKELPSFFGGGCRQHSIYFQNGIEIHYYDNKRYAVFKDVKIPIRGGMTTSIKSFDHWGDGTFVALVYSMSEAQNLINKLETKQTAKDISFSIKDKTEQCKVIGFEPETEKFADCVLRLVELDVKNQTQNQIASAQNSGNLALVQELQKQNNLKSSQALIDLGQQLMQPKRYNSNVYLPQTQRCTIQGFGTFAKMTCR